MWRCPRMPEPLTPREIDECEKLLRIYRPSRLHAARLIATIRARDEEITRLRATLAGVKVRACVGAARIAKLHGHERDFEAAGNATAAEIDAALGGGQVG